MVSGVIEVLPVNKIKAVRLQQWVRTESERRHLPDTGNGVSEGLEAGRNLPHLETRQKS